MATAPRRVSQGFVMLALLVVQSLSPQAEGERPAAPAAEVRGATSMAAPAAHHPSDGLREVSITLDGVTISLRTPFLPDSIFHGSRPGDASQVATSVAWRPFRELSITAVSFGTRPGTETLPLAWSGGEGEYLATLRDHRTGQGARIQAGATAIIFGRPAVGLVSLVDLPVDGPAARSILMVEWVAEAGKRLWIVRASQEQPSGVTESEFSASFLGAIGRLVLDGSSLDPPSSSLPGPRSAVGGQPSGSYLAPTSTQPVNPAGLVAEADLPSPAWWNGSDCDHSHYFASSGGRGSYRLGAVYRGMPACGPRPWADGAPDVLVRFFPGAWGEYEWECVELSMRYLYLAHGIAPYSANGKDVVWNYSGSTLRSIGNGTVNAAPVPGDVLSYGPTQTYGHTSVVMASSVDGYGNGSIVVAEQNYSATGASTLSVSNWTVNGNAGSVSGWLHYPSPPPPATPTPTPTPTLIPTATPTPTATASPSPTPTPTSGPTSPQVITLHRGWNWFSFATAPAGSTPTRLELQGVPALPVAVVLESIEGRYDFVLGEAGSYGAPPAPAYLNSLATLEPGKGYLIRMREDADLVLGGERLSASTPIPLTPGWRWIGYLPLLERPLPDALASLRRDDGSYRYDYLLGEAGTHVAPPAANILNSLAGMEPGKGYMIRMRELGTLVYSPDG